MSIGEFSLSEPAISQQALRTRRGKAPRSRQTIAKPDVSSVPEAR